MDSVLDSDPLRAVLINKPTDQLVLKVWGGD